MSDELELAGPTRAEHVLNKEQLLRPIARLKPRIEFSNAIYNRWKGPPIPTIRSRIPRGSPGPGPNLGAEDRSHRKAGERPSQAKTTR